SSSVSRISTRGVKVVCRLGWSTASLSSMSLCFSVSLLFMLLLHLSSVLFHFAIGRRAAPATGAGVAALLVCVHEKNATDVPEMKRAACAGDIQRKLL